MTMGFEALTMVFPANPRAPPRMELRCFLVDASDADNTAAQRPEKEAFSGQRARVGY